MIGTAEGVVSTRTIYRRPLENRWSVERITSLTATPWSTRDKSDPTVSFQDASSEEEKKNEEKRQIESVPKAFRINHGDLLRHGFTGGCPQCDYNGVHKKSKAGLSHTAACRTRMLEALMQKICEAVKMSQILRVLSSEQDRIFRCSLMSSKSSRRFL